MCLPLVIFSQENKEVKVTTDLDTNHVRLGIYVDVISHVDVTNDTYTVVFYLWCNSVGQLIKMEENTDVLNCIDKKIIFREVDSVYADGRWYYSEMLKVKSVVLNSFNTENYPFDDCKLNLDIEILDHIQGNRVLIIDEANSRTIPDFISGWMITKSTKEILSQSWNSNFGDMSPTAPAEYLDEFKTIDNNHSPSYETLHIAIYLERGSWGIYFKLFFVLFLSMLLALSSVFLPNSKSEEKISIIIGALFAAVGNKYITDSNIPIFESFGLSDNLHLITVSGLLMLVVYAIVEQRKKMQDSLKQDFGLFLSGIAAYFSVVFLVTYFFCTK
jgi:hypothetical protein